MKKYQVTVEYRGRYETEMMADSEAEAIIYAEEEAQDEFSFADCDVVTSCELDEDELEEEK